MGKDDSTLTNITLQTFASDGDVALVDQRWEKDGPAFTAFICCWPFVL